MESSGNSAKSSGASNRVVIAAAVIILAVVLAVGAFFLLQKDDGGSGAPAIGYAAEAKVMLDENTLQAAVNEALKNAQDGNIALLYKNNAYSTDGVNFDCYIVNSADNSYDMFLTIFADAELQDQIFVSELLAPGSGFEQIALERALELGDHLVYVAVTQVTTDENGEQAVHKQVVHTMDFHVTEE